MTLDGQRARPRLRTADATSSLPGTGWFFCRPAALRVRYRPQRVCSSLAPGRTAKSLRLCPTLIRLQPPESGNPDESGQMIFQHYRELVTEKAGKAWFAITPESTKALREKAEKERQAKIVPHPALAAA